MWVDLYLLNSGWEQDSVHKVTQIVIQYVSKRKIGKEDLWLKKKEKKKKAQDQLSVSADFPHETKW